MVQKRCYRGEFRLRQDPVVRQILQYSLAYTANKYGIDLHEFVVMFNHDHLEQTDPLGKRPRFLQDFHSLVGRAVNAYFGDKEALYSSRRYSAQILPAPKDRMRKLVYILANPVEAGIVRDPREYGGVSSWGMEYDRPITIRRPGVFFSENMPETVELVIRRPPGLRPDLSDRALRQLVRGETLQEAKRLVAEIKAAGRRFMGFDRAMRTPRTRATQGALGPGGLRAEIRPHVAAADPGTRAMVLETLATFFRRHKKRMDAWRSGDRVSPFPAGTYQMRVVHGALVEPTTVPWAVAQPP